VSFERYQDFCNENLPLILLRSPFHKSIAKLAGKTPPIARVKGAKHLRQTHLSADTERENLTTRRPRNRRNAKSGASA